jgi:NAD(P)-dependent dehydrogenase (short-subunit alcohol dehydrogenase family)
MSEDLVGRVALVTGGGQGIGRAIAVRLASAGCDIAVGERRAETVPDVLAAVRALGRRAIGQVMDVSRPDEAEALVRATLAEFGRLDLVVNNAAAHKSAKIYELSVEDWDRIMRVCLDGPFYVTRAALPAMLEARRGHIVNISSSAATSSGGTVAYGAAKLGMERLTTGLAQELAEFGIVANAIRLDHGTDTPTAREWYGHVDPAWWPPEVMAELVYHLAVEGNALTGQVLLASELARRVPAAALAARVG